MNRSALFTLPNTVSLSRVVLALAFVLVNRLLFRESETVVATRKLDLFRVFEGDTTRIDLDLHNPGKRLLFLEVRDRLPRQLKVADGGASYDFLALPRGGRANLHYEVQAPLLGVYEVGPTDLRLEDPFGLFFEERAVAPPDTLWVLPRKEDLRKAALLSHLPLPLMGEHQVNRPGDGFDFFALREYVPGDTMRAIKSPREVELIRENSAAPGVFAPDSKAIRLRMEAFKKATGVRPLLVRVGGTLPIYPALAAKGIPTIGTGFALRESNVHSPNERLRVQDIDRAVAAASELYRGLAALG